MSSYKMQPATILYNPLNGVPFGFLGGDGREYSVLFSTVASSGTAAAIAPPLNLAPAGVTATLTLTNPLIQATNSVNNFTQVAIQNLSAGTSSSSDHICYPDNNANDLTGFCNIGMTSSAFADAAYTVTGFNEAYLFGSAPSGASKSGSLVLATDATGTNNNIEFYVGGFNKAKTAYSCRIVGSNGLFQVKEGLGMLAKTIVNNGATTTYTVAAKTSYVYITTSAASLAFTFPAAAAAIDGITITVVTSASVATTTWASTGATFAGAPASMVLNTPVRFVYDHASLIWYIA